MNRLNYSQKNKVQEVKNIVGAHVPDQPIIDLLKNTYWDTTAAIHNFYD